MKRNVIAVTLMSLLAVVVMAGCAGRWRCPRCGMAMHMAGARQMCQCPMCMMARAAETKPVPPAGRGMMPMMRISGPMMMRCRMMMAAQTDPNDPAAILALKDELGLTAEQVAKLDTLAQQAREGAQAVLTEEQRAKLKELAGTPKTMMEMHRQMMERMGGMQMEPSTQEGGAQKGGQ